MHSSYYDLTHEFKWIANLPSLRAIHPTRAEYYTKAAVFYDLSIPQFECSDSDPKRIIMADKICRDLGFAYRYPNPDDMLEKRSDF